MTEANLIWYWNSSSNNITWYLNPPNLISGTSIPGWQIICEKPNVYLINNSTSYLKRRVEFEFTIWENIVLQTVSVDMWIYFYGNGSLGYLGVGVERCNGGS